MFPPVESLLARGDALRRLARHMLRDAALADDVVQETWLAALRRPATAPRDVGGWLAGTLRHLARKALRRERRMAARAARAVRPPAASPPDDVVARLETQAMLLRAVRDLAEPYRTAITRRYFDGQPPRRIAAADGVPVATVRSQLRRGLEQLREALDARPGGRRQWAGALLPLAGRVATDAPALAPVLAAPSLVAGAVLAAVAAIVVGVRHLAPPTTASSASAQVEALAPLDAGSGGSPPLAAGPKPRAAIEAGRGSEVDSWDGRATIAGVVVDASGQGVSGVPVVARFSIDDDSSGPYRGPIARPASWRDDDVERSRAVSGPDGRFQLEGLAPMATYDVRAVPAPPHVGSARTLGVVETSAGAVVLSIADGRTVRGRVVSRDGRGVPAVVTVEPSVEADLGGRSGPTRGATDADGRFEARVMDAPIRVGIRVADRSVWFTRTSPWDGERAFEVERADGATAEGRVIAPGGVVVPGAAVLLSITAEDATVGDAWVVEATADATGRWRAEGLPPGRIGRASATAAGFAPAADAQRGLRSVAGGTVSFDLFVRPSRAVRGVVVDEAGVPVAGATVRLECYVDDDLFHRKASAGQDGRFGFEGLPPGHVTLVAWSAVHVPRPRGRGVSAADDAGAFRADGRAPVYASISDGDADVEVVVAEGRWIAGRVVDERGSAVASAVVRATSDGEAGEVLGVVPGLLPVVALSDADGSFRVGPLPPVADVALAAWTDALRAPARSGLDLRSTDVRELTIRAVASATVGGRVLDADGSTVRGTVEARDPAGQVVGAVPTDRDGRYLLRGLGAGVVELRARGRRAAPSSTWPRVSLEPGGRVDDVEVRVEPRHTISGVVVGPDGRPAGRVRIEYRPEGGASSSGAGPYGAASADDGSFEVAVPPGTYRFTVGDGATGTVLEAGAKGVTLRAGGPARLDALEGTVLGPDGAPVGGFTIRTWQGGRGAFHATDAAFDGPSFRIVPPVGEPAAFWVTTARRVDGAPLEIQPCLIAPAPSQPIVVRLAAGRAVGGRVVDASGAPVRARIVAVPAGSDGVASPPRPLEHVADVGDDGRFRIAGLPDGDVHLHVEPRAPWLAPTSPVRTTSGRGDVVVTLARGGSVEGRVVGPDGEGVVGWHVSADVAPASRRATTDATGAFLLDGLPTDPGEVRLVARADARTPAASAAFLPSGIVRVGVGARGVTIRVRRGAFVEGRVLDPTGLPVVVGEVQAVVRWEGTDDRRGFASSRLDAEGRFRVGPVEPGACRIHYQPEMARPRWASRGAVSVTAPARGAELSVASPTSLRGHVAGGAKAAIARWNPRDGNPGIQAAVAADGTFRLDGLAPQAGLLYVVEEDGDRYVLREGILPSDATVELDWANGASISGRVEGLPQGGHAWVVAARGGLVVDAVLASDRTFRIRALPPGSYTLRLGGSFSAHPADLLAGSADVVLRAFPR